jgi:hypothetical protein
VDIVHLRDALVGRDLELFLRGVMAGDQINDLVLNRLDVADHVAQPLWDWDVVGLVVPCDSRSLEGLIPTGVKADSFGVLKRAGV